MQFKANTRKFEKRNAFGISLWAGIPKIRKSTIYRCLRKFADFCENLPIFAKICRFLRKSADCENLKIFRENLQIFAKICKFADFFANICIFFAKIRNFCENLQIFAKICRFLRKFTDCCENMPIFAKICRFFAKNCRFLRKYADFCENLQIFAKIRKLASKEARPIYFWIFGFLRKRGNLRFWIFEFLRKSANRHANFTCSI